ncbi:hypothetical protein [Chitinophaga sp. 212800008-4]
MLLLSWLPCNDHSSEAGGQVVMATSHEHESGFVDFCSPLCICSCCNVQVTPSSSIIVYFHIKQALIDYPVLPVNPLPSLPDNIWQPPQLV